MLRGLCLGKKCLELFMAALFASLHCVGCSATLAAENEKEKKITRKETANDAAVLSVLIKSNCNFYSKVKTQLH